MQSDIKGLTESCVWSRCCKRASTTATLTQVGSSSHSADMHGPPMAWLTAVYFLCAPAFWWKLPVLGIRISGLPFLTHYLLVVEHASVKWC